MLGADARGSKAVYGGAMPTRASRAETLAQRLLDAQVAYHLSLLDDDRLAQTTAQALIALLERLSEHQLVDLLDRDAVAQAAVHLLRTVPGSGGAISVVELATTVLLDGPDEPFLPGDVVDRAQVEALLTAVLRLTPALERGLEELADSPLAGVVASRFMGRIVAEVVQANQAVASRVPGLGPLVSFGTSTASRLKGAADKQFESLLGDTVGKGGTYAVRRLNKIVVDTLRDPTTGEAALQVWDQLARQPAAGLGSLVGADDVAAVVSAGHDLVATIATTEEAARLAEVLVDAVLEWFGGYTPAELLTAFGLSTSDVVEYLTAVVRDAVVALRDSGAFERALRAHLEPFYSSPSVRDILA